MLYSWRNLANHFHPQILDVTCFGLIDLIDLMQGRTRFKELELVLSPGSWMLTLLMKPYKYVLTPVEC
jgi:hypothetical protein